MRGCWKRCFSGCARLEAKGRPTQAESLKQSWIVFHPCRSMRCRESSALRWATRTAEVARSTSHSCRESCENLLLSSRTVKERRARDQLSGEGGVLSASLGTQKSAGGLIMAKINKGSL